MRAASTPHAQKTVGQYAAFEKALELLFDKSRQAHTGFRLNLGEEGLQNMLPGVLLGCAAILLAKRWHRHDKST